MIPLRFIVRLWPYLKAHVGLLLASFLLAFPLAAIRLAPAPVLRYLVDGLLIGKDPKRLLLLPAGLIAIYLINFPIRFFHYFCLRVVVARVNQRLKNALFDHLMGLSADYFTAQSTGQLMGRVNQDVQLIDGGIFGLNTIVREPVTLIFIFAYNITINWKLTVLTMAIFPVLAWVFVVSGRNLKRYIQRMNETVGRLLGTLQESFSGIRVVKTFRLERYVRRKFRERSEEFARYMVKSSVLEEASHPLVELLTALALAPILYFGGSQVLSNRLSPGELIGFFGAFALLMNPIRMLNEVNLKFNSASAATDRIFEVFGWKSHLVESPNPLPLRGLDTGIEFRDVSFAYPDRPDKAVLDHVSFTIQKGQVVALVGASGAGKSSLVSLLPRIFDVTGGAIQIDGKDIREYRLDDLRDHIAVVSQDVFLFDDSIEENIRCGRSAHRGATRKDVREAARKAHALDFIEKLPEKFATRIGERGQKLSGGERQRLSIARAFLREAPILVLDEATSSLDSQSERAVQEALDELMQQRTTLVIAHRLSTIRHADEILVIRDGVIVERGRHDDLIHSGGEYAAFHLH